MPGPYGWYFLGMEPADYADRRNWIARPEGRKLTKSADAFFVGPTVYYHPDSQKHHLMPLSNPVFRAAERLSTFWHDRFLAADCNIFSPYYRQVGMEVLSMPRSRFDRISKTPYHDVRDAFFYYLGHLNGGRPFILAGHSQGSDMLIKLLCHDLAVSSLRELFVAAYLPGYSLTRQELAQFPHLRLAEAEDDTGSIITYNTSVPGLPTLPVVLPGALAVNPLSWKQTTLYAPPELNEESILFEAGRIRIGRRHFTGARIDADTGLLLIDETAWRRLGKPKSLHRFDIALFQGNLETNVRTRLQAFRRRQSSP